VTSLYREENPVIPIRAVHLDLKGLPPTADRLFSLLPVFKAAGYNALLVEWEDAFPWMLHTGLRSETAYSAETVTAFHRRAGELGLEVIPLVQCLGHMETPLALPEYRDLREMPDALLDLNPLAPGARELVQGMVDEVLAATPGLRYFHLGGDESWKFGSHPASAAFIEAHGAGAFYLQHVEPLLDHLIARGVRPILWHDMMIEWDEDALGQLAAKADLCAWGYRGRPDEAEGKHYHIDHIRRLHAAGLTLWGATAYKSGEDKEADTIELIEKREANAEGWMDLHAEIPLQGIFATGWSRNATHMNQYLPIDACLDSLFRVGALLHDGKRWAGEQEELLAALEALNERAGFEAAHAAGVALTEGRRKAWEAIRIAHETVACAAADPRRRGRLHIWQIDGLPNHLKSLEEVAHQVRRALVGRIPNLWIERFLATRILPIREQIGLLLQRASTVSEL
jgi:hexosaminidase